MKKILGLLTLLLLVVSCAEEIDYEPVPTDIVPENLAIEQDSGIRLESYIVNQEVNINIKLPLDSKYRVKILDIESKIISQEKIDGRQGDNLLKIYVNSLPKSSFTIQVEDLQKNVIGVDLFSKN